MYGLVNRVRLLRHQSGYPMMLNLRVNCIVSPGEGSSLLEKPVRVLGQKDDDVLVIELSTNPTKPWRMEKSERDEFFTAPDRPKGDHKLWSAWLDNQLQVRPFDVTISEPAQDGRLDIDSINDGHQEWSVPASLSVPREAKAIVGSVLGLLRLSSEVTLIDPYFYLPGNKTLSEIFIALQGTSVRTVRVVSSVNPQNPQQVYQREYLKLNNRGVGLEWVVAPKIHFHDRYLITDVGAIRVGHGFVEDIVKGIHADYLNINIIGIVEAQRTLQSLQILLDEERATQITVV